MWNAPLAQADHAAHACRAAQALLGELPGLNECWGSRVQTTLALGVGVNTGDALVGNTGCLRRLKYGPLGNTVNLASRVEGATERLGVPLLITGTTRALIGDSFPTHGSAGSASSGLTPPPTCTNSTAAIPPRNGSQRATPTKRPSPSVSRGNGPRRVPPSTRSSGVGGRVSISPRLALLARASECLRSPPDTAYDVIELSHK